MLELIAQGTQPDYRWRRPIPEETVFLLGRTTQSFRVPWDDRVSRSHTRMQLVDGRLLIQKLEEAANRRRHRVASRTIWLASCPAISRDSRTNLPPRHRFSLNSSSTSDPKPKSKNAKPLGTPGSL